MVEATNYIYLAFIICLHYLGIQHESYQVTINFSEVEGFEEQQPITVDLVKLEQNENKWQLVSPDGIHKIPLSIVKDSVIDYGSGAAKTTLFSDINFNKLIEQKDTIFNNKDKAVATIIKNNKNIKFKMLDDTIYQEITMSIIQSDNKE